jgi:hypothetical protein
MSKPKGLGHIVFERSESFSTYTYAVFPQSDSLRTVQFPVLSQISDNSDQAAKPPTRI